MARRLTTKLGQRLRIALGVGALAAMATLPFVLGAWSSDTGSPTTVVANPTTIRTGPSAAPNQTAAPFNGGWVQGFPFTGGWGTGQDWWIVINNKANGGQ